MVVTIHINPSQPHQREHAEWFKSGLKRHGIELKITTDIRQPSDIHIISGPHYAKPYFLGKPNVILIDRAYYRDGEKPSGMASMPCVSLGWMRDDGGRYFKSGSGREPVVAKDPRTGSRTIFLADYDGPAEQADTVRLHPARAHTERSLLDDLSGHAIAIGYQTSALVTAALEGLTVICKDKRNIMAEPNWLELLPYADWHYSEIESGEAWEHLSLSLNQVRSQ